MFISYQLTMSFWSRIKLLFGIPLFVEVQQDDSKPNHLVVTACVKGEEDKTVVKATCDFDTSVITTE